MKIRMKDFLCYKDSTFDFGDSGIALLSGPSGVGKTSILRGIFFALFGEGNKLQANGSSSCRVEFDFDNIKIVRTKRPNRLVVNEVHEDECAQEIINKMFGDTFKISGYIQQNNLNSFVLMSPVEKLAFLEKFTFRDVDLGKIKGRCKAYISQTNDALVGVVSQLGMAKNVLEEMEQPIEVKFPLKCKISEREKAIKNEKIRLQNCCTLMMRNVKESKKLAEEISDLKILEATLKSRKETLKDLELVSLKNINSEIDSIHYEGENVLSEYEQELSAVIALRELYAIEKQLKSDSEKLEEMRFEEDKIMKNKLAEYTESLWKEYSKKELISTVNDLKKCISDLSLVESFREELKNNFICPEKHKYNNITLELKEIEMKEKQNIYDKLLSQQGLYSCPSCFSKLRFSNEELIIASEKKDEELIKANLEVLKVEIKSLKNSISKLEKVIQEENNKIERNIVCDLEITKILSTYEEIPDIQSVKDDLEYLQNYNASQNEIENKKKEIEICINEGKFSSSYFSFKKGVEKLQSRRDSLHNKYDGIRPKMNEEEIRELITEQKQNRDKLLAAEKRKIEINDNISNCKKVLDNSVSKHIKLYGKVENEDELEMRKKDIDDAFRDLENKKKKYEKSLKDIEIWEKYQSNLENYRGWELKVEELESMEKIARNEYASATRLKDKILEAESMAMLNIIDSINTHARVYLDCFFQSEPISVNLQTFKETKKSTKPQINIEIEYKGMEADLNMLSGGELSRVILAYTMALAEMFNTPLLLLDECTASLDQDLSETVFNSIRENFNGKIILLIAHQVVTGTFDKIIKLGITEE